MKTTLHFNGFWFAFNLVIALTATLPVKASITCDETFAILSFPRGKTMYDKKLVPGALTRSKAVIIGSEISNPNIDTVERMADSGGISTIVLDGPLDNPREVTNLINALGSSPTVLLLRTKDANDPRIKPNLDAGAFGLVLVDPKSTEDVAHLLEQIYLGPLGDRKVGPSKVNNFLDVPDFAQLTRMENEINESMIGAVEITKPESLFVMDHLSELREKGLKLVTLDLDSLARAWNLDKHSEEFQRRIAPLEEKLNESGVVFGAKIEEMEEATSLAQKGYRHFNLGSDRLAISRAIERFRDKEVNPEIEFVSQTPADRQKSMKEIVEGGKMLHASFLMTPDLEAAKELAKGAESLWIDAEHGPFSPESVIELIKNLKDRTRVVVRVPQPENPHIRQYLSAGAQAIVAPNVGSGPQAAAFARTVKESHPNAMAVAIIETKKGYENRKEIVAAEGIDVIHLGPFDLAQSLKVPRGSEAHKKAVAEIEEAAKEAGRPLGGLAGTRSISDQKFADGYRFLTNVSDQEAYSTYFKSQFPANNRVELIESNDQLGYYDRPFVVKPDSGNIWKVDGDGTKVALFHGGPNMTIQLAVKQGESLVDGKSVSHAHPQGQLTYIVKGEAKLRDGDHTIPLKAGDFVFIPPRVTHAFEDIGGQEEFIWMDVFTHNRFKGRPDPKANEEEKIPVN